MAIDVTPGAPSEASRAAAAGTSVEMTGDPLLIETPHAKGFIIRRSAAVKIRVHVPTNSRVQINSASADVRCAGRLGEVDVNSTSGDLRLDHVSGDLKRRSASGDTQFNQVDGDLSLHAASGDVQGGSVSGGITVRSASGDTTLDAVGGSVKAQSASGDIKIGNLAVGTARIHSASGDVEIGVAAGVSVWLDLTSISGDTTSDLPVSDAAPTGGAATLSLHVRTSSGDIKVRRALVAPANPAPAGSAHTVRTL